MLKYEDLGEPPAYLKEMQIILTGELIMEAQKQTLTIQQLVRRLKARGAADEEIRKLLLNDLNEGGPLFGEFRKQFKAHSKYGLEESARGEVREAFATAKVWDWVAISDGRLCPDCLERHNMNSKTWEEWQKIGLPGQGATLCQQNCRCDLIPIGLIDKNEIPGGIIRDKKQGKKLIENKVNINKFNPITINNPNKYIKENAKEWYKYIDKNNHLDNAIYKYGKEDYQTLNSYLRGQLKIADEKYVTSINNWANNLDKTFTDKLKDDLILYRGIHQNAIGSDLKRLIGTTISDSGFISTTLDKNVAKSFGNLIIRIKAKKGTPISWVERIIQKGESEILLQRNSKFKVTRVIDIDKTYKKKITGNPFIDAMSNEKRKVVKIIEVEIV